MNEYDSLQEEFWSALKAGTVADFYKRHGMKPIPVTTDGTYEPDEKIWNGLLDDYARATDWTAAIDEQCECKIWSIATKTRFNTDAQIRVRNVGLTFFPNEPGTIFEHADYIEVFSDDDTDDVIMVAYYEHAFVRVDTE